MYKLIILSFLLIGNFIVLQAQHTNTYFENGTHSFRLLNTNTINSNTKLKPVVIAVIDDAFSTTHKRLAPYYFTNSSDIKNNLIDDDKNGFTDDFRGWDLADGDNQVNGPFNAANANNFTHGSMVAGVIIQAAELTLGQELTKKTIRILPIKILSDKATTGNYEQGYEGIKYAIDMGADIICLAWSGGPFDKKYLSYFELAKQKGILIFASAGNYNSETVPYPGSLPGVYSIAALDTNFTKLPLSNFNQEIALSAVAQNVTAPYALNDTLYSYLENTSAAVALVSGCAAVVKAFNPKLRAHEIIEILQNTSKNIEQFNPDHRSKLGSGVIDMRHVLDYMTNDKKTISTYFDSKRPKGSIFIDNKHKVIESAFDLLAKESTISFSITGNTSKLNRTILHFKDDTGKLLHQYSLQDFPESLPITAKKVYLQVTGKTPSTPIRLNYQVTNLDSATYYCKETIYLDKNEGVIEDGSGVEPYTGNNSCKWLITVEKGNNIELNFSTFATEEQKDNVLIFKGTDTLQDNLMARFSGHKLPPKLVIDGNQVLIWFLTDQRNHDQGFKLRYKATKNVPGIVEIGR